MIDWKNLKTQKIENTPFFAIILGPSGSGKSTLIGTLNVPTLFLYTSAEFHGPKNAAAVNKNIIPMCVDQDSKGNPLTADETYQNIMDILSNDTIVKNVSAVALDSATELDQIIRKTKTFSKACLTDKGTHNNWAESGAVISHFKPVLGALRELNSDGIHCLVTCAAVTKSLDEAGAASEITPKLLGYESAHDLIRHFSDVLVVSRYNYTNEETQAVDTIHALLFKANATKTSRDLKGNVVKTANFTPRLSGLLAQDLPDVIRADLQKLLAIKNKKGSE